MGAGAPARAGRGGLADLTWDNAATLDVVDVPGNLLTMMEGHARTTGHAVEAWPTARWTRPVGRTGATPNDGSTL